LGREKFQYLPLIKMAKRRFRFASETTGWAVAIIAIVVLVLSGLILAKTRKLEKYTPKTANQIGGVGYAPPLPVAGQNYTGLWDAKVCKGVFNDPNFDPEKQKNCLNRINDPDCSDYPMHFCGGQAGPNQSFDCAMIPAAGVDSAGSASCQQGYGVAFSVDQCDKPLLSSGQMYCGSSGFYSCDKICDPKTSPVAVDPASNMWGFDRACSNVITETPGLQNCSNLA